MSNRRIKQLRDEVSKELFRLYQEKQGLRPSEVVASAKDKKSPLHDCFVWDDKKAGHEYRLMQARSLIRITVLPERFVHVPDDNKPLHPVPEQPNEGEEVSREGVYHPISVVVQSPEWFGRALAQLSGKMHAAIAACEELRDAAKAERGDDEVARINLAVMALQNAHEVIKTLH